MNDMTQSNQILGQVLVQIGKNREQGLTSLVVFDLDSTLFNVAPRMEKILREFAQVPDHRARFPKEIEAFDRIQMQKGDWGIFDSLVRAGLDGHHPELEEAVREFWKPRFFSDSYLNHDVPYDGAAEYVRAIEENGADIVYLTGRDVARMGRGSLEVLEKWDFPVDGARSHLVLKPDKAMDDALFKTDWFLALPKDKYADIWFFENEPVNIHSLMPAAAHVKIIFFDSTHSGKAAAPTDLPTVIHFLMGDLEKPLKKGG